MMTVDEAIAVAAAMCLAWMEGELELSSLARYAELVCMMPFALEYGLLEPDEAADMQDWIRWKASA